MGLAKNQNPLQLIGDGNQIRHFTYGGDLAEGIKLCIENEKTINDDFNLSNETPTKIIDLAKLIWSKIKTNENFNYISEKPYKYDVQYRSPNVEKAKKILGFEAKTSLDQSLNEIIPWVEEQIKIGGI